MARPHRKPRPDLDERFKFDATPEEVFNVMLADDPDAPKDEDGRSEDAADPGESQPG